MIDKNLVDELGSGVRNIHKYGKTYFGYEPQIIEDEIFKIIFKTLEKSSTHQATDQADDKINEMIEFCKEPKTRVELQEFMEMKDRYHFRIRGGVIMGLDELILDKKLNLHFAGRVVRKDLHQRDVRGVRKTVSVPEQSGTLILSLCPKIYKWRLNHEIY